MKLVIAFSIYGSILLLAEFWHLWSFVCKVVEGKHAIEVVQHWDIS